MINVLQPYTCAFYDHCNAPRAAYSIYELSRATKAIATLEALKIEFLADIPNDFPLTARQKTIVEASKTDESIIDRDRYQRFPQHVDRIRSTTSISRRSIRRFRCSTKRAPTRQFRFSSHFTFKTSLDGDCVHHEFLLEERQDPREELIQEMLRLLGTSGSIVAYNMTFEIQCIKGLADSFPEYADRPSRSNSKIP